MANIDYDNFQKSLKHLEDQFANYKESGERTELRERDKQAIAESVIHRFETCFDSLWKVLKRYLNEELGAVNVPDSPKPILRIAHANALFNSDIALWIKYADARNDTSHDYSLNKAEGTLALMGDFIPDAIDLYITMTKKTWE
jgi:nucleotidyltransferase substrate binding protein (TIGR01987 family)